MSTLVAPAPVYSKDTLEKLNILWDEANLNNGVIANPRRYLPPTEQSTTNGAALSAGSTIQFEVAVDDNTFLDLTGDQTSIMFDLQFCSTGTTAYKTAETTLCSTAGNANITRIFNLIDQSELTINNAPVEQIKWPSYARDIFTQLTGATAALNGRDYWQHYDNVTFDNVTQRERTFDACNCFYGGRDTLVTADTTHDLPTPNNGYFMKVTAGISGETCLGLVYATADDTKTTEIGTAAQILEAATNGVGYLRMAGLPTVGGVRAGYPGYGTYQITNTNASNFSNATYTYFSSGPEATVAATIGMRATKISDLGIAHTGKYQRHNDVILSTLSRKPMFVPLHFFHNIADNCTKLCGAQHLRLRFVADDPKKYLIDTTATQAIVLKKARLVVNTFQLAPIYLQKWRSIISENGGKLRIPFLKPVTTFVDIADSQSSYTSIKASQVDVRWHCSMFREQSTARDPFNYIGLFAMVADTGAESSRVPVKVLKRVTYGTTVYPKNDSGITASEYFDPVNGQDYAYNDIRDTAHSMGAADHEILLSERDHMRRPIFVTPCVMNAGWQLRGYSDTLSVDYTFDACHKFTLIECIIKEALFELDIAGKTGRTIINP